MASIPVIHRKRGPTPTGQTPVTSIRLAPDVLEGMGAWVASQPAPQPSRSAAINQALRDWLTGLGYLPHREDPEGAN